MGLLEVDVALKMVFKTNTAKRHSGVREVSIQLMNSVNVSPICKIFLKLWLVQRHSCNGFGALGAWELLEELGKNML